MRKIFCFHIVIVMATFILPAPCYASGFGRALLAGIAEGALDSAADAAEAAAEGQQGYAAPSYARPAATNYQGYLQQTLAPGSVLYNRPCTISDGVHERGVPCEAAAAIVSAPVPRGVFPLGPTVLGEETYGADDVPGYEYDPSYGFGAYGHHRAGFARRGNRQIISAGAGYFHRGSPMSFGRMHGRHR